MYNNEKITKTINSPKTSELIKVPKNYLGMRGITSKTMQFYDVRSVVNNQTSKPEKLIFPYGEDGQKLRFLKEKEFTALGNMSNKGLFGMERFTPGQSMSITITEGELDALSVFQLLGSKYPVVSVRSSTTAKEDCRRCWDYLNAFQRIYLCFDNDNPGKDAARAVRELFHPGKVFLVKLGEYKDANDMLQAGKEKEFLSVWHNSKQFIPDGIVSKLDDLSSILGRKKQVAKIDYPFPTLQEMTYGIRSKELVLVTAQEKIGKTEFLRKIEHHILKNTDDSIGIIHLEEDEERTLHGLVGLDLGKPVHLPDSVVSLQEQQDCLKSLIGYDDRLVIYPHFGSDDPNVILDIIRSMVAVLGCKYIFIDHITMLVTGFEGEDERKKLDYLSTKFAELTRELDFTMFLISHVNDDGKTRGSRNIAKMADLIISLNRDIENQDENIRNTTYLNVRGNRFSGRTGPAGSLWFEPSSFSLSELRYDNDNEANWSQVA